MQVLTRVFAVTGLVIIVAAGLISAFRHEEIYIICAVAWCIALAHTLELAGIAWWGLGFLIVGFCLLPMGLSLVSALSVSAAIAFVPNNRLLLRSAAVIYTFLSLAVGGPLYFILTNDHLGSLLKNASGPRLSSGYVALPALFASLALLFHRLSKQLLD